MTAFKSKLEMLLARHPGPWRVTANRIVDFGGAELPLCGPPDVLEAMVEVVNDVLLDL
jgi:hypothetical protein